MPTTTRTRKSHISQFNRRDKMLADTDRIQQQKGNQRSYTTTTTAICMRWEIPYLHRIERGGIRQNMKRAVLFTQEFATIKLNLYFMSIDHSRNRNIKKSRMNKKTVKLLIRIFNILIVN